MNDMAWCCRTRGRGSHSYLSMLHPSYMSNGISNDEENVLMPSSSEMVSYGANALYNPAFDHIQPEQGALSFPREHIDENYTYTDIEMMKPIVRNQSVSNTSSQVLDDRNELPPSSASENKKSVGIEISQKKLSPILPSKGLLSNRSNSRYFLEDSSRQPRISQSLETKNHGMSPLMYRLNYNSMPPESEGYHKSAIKGYRKDVSGSLMESPRDDGIEEGNQYYDDDVDLCSLER